MILQKKKKIIWKIVDDFWIMFIAWINALLVVFLHIRFYFIWTSRSFVEVHQSDEFIWETSFFLFIYGVTLFLTTIFFFGCCFEIQIFFFSGMIDVVSIYILHFETWFFICFFLSLMVLSFLFPLFTDFIFCGLHCVPD